MRCASSSGPRSPQLGEITQQLFQFAGKIIGRSKFFGHRPRSETGENETGVVFSAEGNAFEHVFAQIDANNRICASGHDAAVPPVAGNVPCGGAFW